MKANIEKITNSKEISHIRPAYYDKFQCTGPNCSYNCCHGWNVTANKNYYHTLKNATVTPELREKIDKHMDKLPNGKNETFCNFVLDEHGDCNMLDEDKLCSIHKELGHQYLSYVCKSFPRMHTQYLSDTFQSGCSLGCEETVKSLFDEVNGVEFLSEQVNMRDEFDGIKAFRFSESVIKKRPLLKNYWDINIMCLGILQNRFYSMDDRIILLGVALKKLDELEKNKNYDRILPFIESIINMEDDSTFLQSLKSLPSNPRISILNFANYSKPITMSRAAFASVRTKAYENLGMDVQINWFSTSKSDENKKFTINQEAPFTVNYDDEKYLLMKERYAKYLETHEYFVENLFVNTFFCYKYPIHFSEKSIWENYMLFASEYSFYKTFILSSLNESVDNHDDIKHMITVLGRSYQHAEPLQKEIIQNLNNTQSNTLAHIVLLVNS